MKREIREAFDLVQADEALKRQTQAAVTARLRKTESRRHPPLLRRLAATSAVACMIVSGGFLFYTPVSAISVDVNPSVELGINRFDRVVSVTGYHDADAALASAMQVKYMVYTDALEQLMASDVIEQYRQADEVVSITVLGDTAEKNSEMLSKISDCAYSQSGTVTCHAGRPEEVQQAHDAGMSFGKYQAFLELQQLDPSITAEEGAQMTMRQIRECIASAHQTDETTGSGSACAENAAGQGNGAGNGNGNHQENGAGHGTHGAAE